MMDTWSLRSWLGLRHTKHFDRTKVRKRSQCMQEGRQELCSYVSSQMRWGRKELALNRSNHWTDI